MVVVRKSLENYSFIKRDFLDVFHWKNVIISYVFRWKKVTTVGCADRSGQGITLPVFVLFTQISPLYDNTTSFASQSNLCV